MTSLPPPPGDAVPGSDAWRVAAIVALAALLLGAWYERISRRTDDPAIREKAVNAYRKAVALDPANEKAKAGLKRLAP